MTDDSTSALAQSNGALTIGIFNEFKFVFVDGVLVAVARKSAGYFNEDFIDDSDIGRRVLRAVGDAPLVGLSGRKFAQSVAYLLAYYQQNNITTGSTEN